MSKAVKTVVSVVAAIAIPFVAPVIASTIGLSGAIAAAGAGATAGSVIGGAIVGAGLGAVKGAILGEDVGRSALMGGIGGGISGYVQAPIAGTSAPGAATPAYTGPGSVTPTLTAGTSFDAMGNVVPIGTIDPTTGMAVSSLSGMNYGYGASGFGFPTATPDLGAQLSKPTLDMGNISQGISYYGMEPTSFTSAPTLDMGDISQGISYYGMEPTAGLTPPTTAATGGYTYDAYGNVVPAGGEAGPAISGVTPTSSVVSAPSPATAVTAGTAGTAATPKTFSEALRRVPAEIAAKFTDPKALADLTLRAAGQLAGSVIAGDGLTAEERALLEAQTQELRDLRQANQSLFNQRLEQAQALIGESRYFDPEYFGLQRARRAQIAGARTKRAGLRGLTGGAREAEARRFDLATGRDVGTAFGQGYGVGVQGRLQTMQAGLSMMPTAYPSSATEYSNLRQAYAGAADRRRQTQADIGSLFGSLTGRA